MKLFIKAKPNSKHGGIEKISPSPGRESENHFIVSVKEPPIKGRANAAILIALADYFKIPLSRISIVSGHASKQKIVEIRD